MGFLNWFRSRPECPVDADTRAWVDHRWRWLEGEFGRDRLRAAPVVLPRPQFFPDPFHGAEDDVRPLLDRVCGYIGLDPDTIELSLYDDQGPVAGHPFFGGRRDGTAGLYHAEGGRFRVWVEATNLADPLALVATLAHELGHVHLLGHGRVSADEPDHEPLTDLLTVFLGMGVITANAVIREKYWHEGQTSGWSIGRSGYLTMPAFGYALARFAQARDEENPAWASELRPDVRAAFRQAFRFWAAEDANRSAGPGQ